MSMRYSEKRFSLLRYRNTVLLLSVLLIALTLPATILLLKERTVYNGHAAGPSFIFTAGGDIGGSSNTAATLDLIATSSSSLHLALGDLSYSEIKPEPSWCSFIQ